MKGIRAYCAFIIRRKVKSSNDTMKIVFILCIFMCMFFCAHFSTVPLKTMRQRFPYSSFYCTTILRVCVHARAVARVCVILVFCVVVSLEFNVHRPPPETHFIFVLLTYIILYGYKKYLISSICSFWNLYCRFIIQQCTRTICYRTFHSDIHSASQPVSQWIASAPQLSLHIWTRADWCFALFDMFIIFISLLHLFSSLLGAPYEVPFFLSLSIRRSSEIACCCTHAYKTNASFPFSCLLSLYEHTLCVRVFCIHFLARFIHFGRQQQ